ncbi:MAG: hypothetical protein KA362_06770 [Chloroflexi bacterium]|nr:hypothetical protein [Chloroflexota bacterium]MBP6803794.1 hypothetical protein [Chloroflexota bacterium]
MMQKKEPTTPLPGIWQTIAAGFDFTSKHLWLLLLPVLLDSFFWLGPRLSGRLIIERFISLLPTDQALLDLNSQLLAMAPRTNLFTSLSVPLLGIPALMVGATPEKTPLPTQIVELHSVATWMGLFLLFSLMGLLLTAVYYTFIAQSLQRAGVDNAPLSGPALMRRVATVWLSLIGLSVVVVIMGLVLYIPLLPISLVLGFISTVLAALALFLGPVIMMWVVIYLFFVPYGLAWHGRSLFQTAVESLQLVRLHIIPTLGLLLALLIIRNLLSMVLLIADDGSWLTLAGMVGHAFVMTSLVAATFIFYRDRYQVLFADVSQQPQPTLE